MTAELTEADRTWLQRSVELARKALEMGHEPFGTLLVDEDGTVLVEEGNRVEDGDTTAHPEIAVARWADFHLSPEQRARATTYTSGEHCPMCSAAHAWVGLGRIAYASSAAQLVEWHRSWGLEESPVAMLSINDVAPGIEVAGPDEVLSEIVRTLHARLHGQEP